MSGQKEKYRIYFTADLSAGESLAVEIPSGLKTIADLLPLFQKIFDRIIALEMADYSISCGPKCGTCCRQLVPISLPEAFHLRDALNRLTPKRRKRFKHRISAILKKIKDAGLFERMLNPRENREVDTIFFKLGLSCPFLEDKSCSIHPHRPLACREYLVTSDKKHCRNPHCDQVQRVRIKRNMAAMLAVFASRYYRIPKDPIPLFHFLEFADNHERFNDLKWPVLEIFDRFMQGLARLNDDRLAISIHHDTF